MADVFEDFKAGLEEAGITNETLQENCADIVGKLGEIFVFLVLFLRDC